MSSEPLQLLTNQQRLSKSVVEVLEELLEKAKEGEIVGVVVCTVHRREDGSDCATVSHSGGLTMPQVTGYMQLAVWDLFKSHY
jgi:hypothetical protein